MNKWVSHFDDFNNTVLVEVEGRTILECYDKSIVPLILSIPELVDALSLSVEALEWVSGGEPVPTMEQKALEKGKQVLARFREVENEQQRI